MTMGLPPWARNDHGHHSKHLLVGNNTLENDHQMMTTENDNHEWDHHDPKKNRIKNKIQPKQASNVEAAATKLSQGKKWRPFLSINMEAGDAQTCLQVQ